MRLLRRLQDLSGSRSFRLRWFLLHETMLADTPQDSLLLRRVLSFSLGCLVHAGAGARSEAEDCHYLWSRKVNVYIDCVSLQARHL